MSEWDEMLEPYDTEDLEVVADKIIASDMKQTEFYNHERLDIWQSRIILGAILSELRNQSILMQEIIMNLEKANEKPPIPERKMESMTVQPYFDEYDDTKHYKQVLFNPRKKIT